MGVHAGAWLLLILDPPTAPTGQSGVATFVGPKQNCTTDGKGEVQVRW
jgi:hypothetical protein